MNNVVIGIDFGTSGIGYAYSFSGDNPNSIILSDFHGQSADNKVPSEIILDNYFEDVLAFGNECKGYIRTHDKTEYEYFKNIKMNLYHKIYTIKSTNGKEANIELIISKILKKISDNAISQIERSSFHINKENIKWVVTIPAIWEEKSKQIMIKASINAGLIDINSDKSLFLALEPEAAGIYYHKSSYYYKCLKKNISYIREENPYIICDIGAGTVDICTHKNIKKGETSELIEEYPPIGGDYGGQKINEEFIKRLIIEIFGEDKVKQLQNNPADEDWDKFEKEIEELKKSCYDNDSKNLILDCSLFEDEDDEKSLEDYIYEYNEKNLKYKYKIQKKKKWKLQFSSQIFLDIVKELSNQIFSKIEEIYNNVHTGYIILTGAGSKNNVILNYFYEFAKEKNMKIEITTPPQPEISIMKGAVLFGFQNNVIRKRKAKYSLGIKMYDDWEDRFEGKGKKVFAKIEGGEKCSNLFSKFITRNQYIEFDEVISRSYRALNPNPEIIFYKTLRENCTFVDERDENGKLIIEEFGKVVFNINEDFDVNKRQVTIKMKLGGTYIDVSAKYEKTGKNLDIVKFFN